MPRPISPASATRPQVTLIYESGTIEAKPDVLPLSIADSELSETAMTVVSIPEMFRYWLQGGWIDVGFLGAAQIDRFANINTTVIGDYAKPVTRLPGAGGAPEIATSAKEIFVMLRMSQRAFMAKLDFVTSLGHGTGAGSRAALGAQGKGPTRVITDLGILEPHPETRRARTDLDPSRHCGGQGEGRLRLAAEDRRPHGGNAAADESRALHLARIQGAQRSRRHAAGRKKPELPKGPHNERGLSSAIRCARPSGVTADRFPPFAPTISLHCR